jgi:hypothetical protein
VIIEIVAEAAHHLPQGARVYICHGAPYLIPPEALSDIPAACYTTEKEHTAYKKKHLSILGNE